MNNITTLNRINRSDTELVGYRAVDLATLFNKKENVPLTFVIKTSLFENFIENNHLKNQIKDTLSDIDYSNSQTLEHAYSKIKDLFSNAQFSKEEEADLLEAYETLAIDMDHLDIAKLVTTIDKPFLLLISSPNYVEDSENNLGILQNIKEKISLFKAIKNCFSSMYSPASLKHRNNNEIQTEEKMAIIVQRMIDATVSTQSFSDEEQIIVKTFFGYQDFDDEFEKDVNVYDKGTLTIKNTKVNIQEQQYVRDMRDNSLTKKDLKELGEKQKLNDKENGEIARLTKKIEGVLEKPVKVFTNISKNKIYLLFANRIIRKKNENVEEEPIEDEPNLDWTKEDQNIQPAKEEINLQTEPDKITEEEITIIQNPSTEAFNIEDDIAFLDEIEEFEKEINTEKQSSVHDDTAIQSNNLESTQSPEEFEETIQSTLGHNSDIDASEQDTNTLTQQSPSIPPLDTVNTETIAGDETTMQEVNTPELNIEENNSPLTTDNESELNTTNETEQEDEEDDFIFSQSDSKEEPDSSDNNLNTTTPNLSNQDMTTPNFEDDKFLQVLNHLKQTTIMSDDAVYDALRKKHINILQSEPNSFEEAINNLKDRINIPFIEEIKKGHDLRIKVEAGEDIDLDTIAISLRTCKNFLTMFK